MFPCLNRKRKTGGEGGTPNPQNELETFQTVTRRKKKETENKQDCTFWPARLVYRGGNLNNGGNAGVGYVNVNNDLGNRNANIGSRLGTKNQNQIGMCIS